MTRVGKRPSERTRTRLQRTPGMSLHAAPGARPRTLPVLVAVAALTALALTGCGGSSQPQINLNPATITGPLPATAPAPAPAATAKLTALEYRRYKSLKAKFKSLVSASNSKSKSAKLTLLATQPSEIATVCRSLGHATRLLKVEGRSCVAMIRFLSTEVRIGECFTSLKSSGAIPGSPTYLSTMYGCVRGVTPLVGPALKLGNTLRLARSVAEKRGFTGKCLEYLVGPSTLPNDVGGLGASTNALASAGQQQNLAAVVADSKTWGAQIKKIGRELNGPPNSIRACKHR